MGGGHTLVALHGTPNHAGGNAHDQGYADGDDGVAPDGHISGVGAVLNEHHHGGGSHKGYGGAESVGHLGEGAQDKGAHQNAQNQAHEAVEPLIGGGHAAVGQDHGYHDGENTHQQGHILTDLGLGGEAQLLLGQTLLNVQGPAGSHGVQTGGQGGLSGGVDGGQQQAGDAHGQLKGNPGREDLVLLGSGGQGVALGLVEGVQTGTNEIEHGGNEDGQAAIGQHHLVQLLGIGGGSEALHDILGGDVGAHGVEAGAHDQQEHTVLQDVGVKDGLALQQELVVGGELVDDGTKAAVQVGDEEDEAEGNTDEQHRALDKVGPQHALQAAGVGVDDGDDAHDDDEDVHVDPHQLREHHAGQVHDDGHTADLIDDKHDGAQHPEELAAEADLQIVVGGVDVQAAVDRQEELDSQRDGQQHTQLGKPQKPAAGVGVAGQGQERDGAEEGGEDRHGGDPPGHGAVTLEVLLALHLLLGEMQAGKEHRQQVHDQHSQIDVRKTLHVHSNFLPFLISAIFTNSPRDCPLQILGLGGAYHLGSGLGDGLVGLLQVLQRLPDAADVQSGVDTQHLLGHSVHVGVAGAHLIDDLVDGVLQLGGLVPLAGHDQLVELEEQLGHHAIGPADAAVSADGPAGHKLLVGSVEHHEVALGGLAGSFEHLDVLSGHGGVLHADDLGVLHHLSEETHGEGGAGQLGDVVDHKVGVGSGGGDGVPVAGNGVLRQTEVDGGNGGDGVHAHLLGVAGQLHTVPGVVAGHMVDDGELALGHSHHILDDDLPLGDALVNALAGGAVDVHTLDALVHKILSQSPDALGADIALLVVAGVKCGDNASVLVQIAHANFLLLLFSVFRFM